jgi:hypothetical protein
LIEVGVGGRQDADIDGNGVGLAERLDLLPLEEAKELRLEIERDFADFVEQQRAAGRAADDAGELGDGAGERASTAAEQLAVEQLFADTPCTPLTPPETTNLL